MAPRVSALIPCYEMAHCVAGAVDSVLAQEGHEVEVVVVDDGSSVDPGPELARFGDRVRLVRQENGGAAAARNRAAAEATGEWLAFLDADDRWLPDKTLASLAALDARPAARFAYGQACGTMQDGRKRVLGAPQGADPMDGRVLGTIVRRGNMIPMLTGMVHRDAFEAVGGLDASLRTGEDYDLWLRLAERYEAAYVPQIIAEYRIHEGGDVMGDVDRWVSAIERIHVDLLARHPDDAELREAVAVGRAGVLFSRGVERLQEGDRRGAREDLLEAARCKEYRSEARRMLRHAMLPAPIYLRLRALLS